MYRIVKYGRNSWYIIEPTRQLLLRNEENNDLLRFWSKEQALNYCKENNLEVSEEMVELPNINAEIGKLDLNPKEACGTLSFKNHADTLVLNWGDSSCVLIMDNFNILDLRKISFDKLTCVELNGFRFVKEANNKV